jgi:hypothetical protein
VSARLVPDSIEPVVGWRCWRVVDTREGFVLSSASRGIAWPPGLALEAACPRGDHDPPSERCSCGIYAAREPELVLSYFPPVVRSAVTIVSPAILGYDSVMAVGTVSLWGDVVESERGWRAQYAYPRELLVPSAVKHYRRGVGRRFQVFDSGAIAGSLGDLYGVPAGVTRTVRPGALAAQCL